MSCFHSVKNEVEDNIDSISKLAVRFESEARRAYRKRNYKDAIFYYKKCKEKCEEQDIKDTIYSTILSHLADCYYNIGNSSSALELEKQSLGVIKEYIGENNKDYAISLGNLAGYYSDIGDYTKAIEFGRQSLNLLKEILGSEDPIYAWALDHLAIYFYKVGDYPEAIDLCKRAMEIRKNILSEGSPEYVTSLNHMALFYSAIGDYKKAVELGTHSLILGQDILDGKSMEYSTLLNDLAFYYFKLGNYLKAVEIGKQAVEIRSKVLGELHPFYASSLCHLATYNICINNNSTALKLGKQSLSLRKKMLGEKHPDYALSLSVLAIIYSNLGNYSKAIELEERAMKIRKESLGENHISYANSMGNIAGFYSDQGDKTKALELCKRSQEIIKKAVGENHPDYAWTLKHLATYYSHLGDYSKAIISYQKYISILYSHILYQLGGLTENLRSSYWSIISSAFTDYYPLYAYKYSSPPSGDLYDKSALFAKGLLLTTEIEMNKLIQESGDEEALSMFEELRQKRLMLQKLYEKPITERVLNTDSLEQEADKLEGVLVKRSQVYGDFSRKLRTTWKDVQAALDKDEMAVEFLSFGVGTDSTMVVALTLRKDDKEPKMIPLFEQKQMEKVKDIKTSRDRDVRKTKTFYSQEVTDLVWKPMAEELKGIKRIYFSAAGILHKVGIEYAPGMEGYDIYRLSTTREVIDMKEKGEKNLNAQSDAVLYGGVDYEALAKSKAPNKETRKNQKDEENTHRSISIDLHHAFIDSLKVRGTTLDSLPGTLEEVKHISSCFELKHRKTITGTDATETSVKSLPDKLPKILHIATHGFYYTEKEKARMDVRKGLLLDDERRQAGRQEDEALNRSGLFMAGANRTLKGEELPMEADDGILTAQEIAKIDLRGVDMVVLSACETGQGDINQGEGVYGLQRGFKKAGVQTILMSLWKVSDKATEILMTEFYKQVCAGLSKRAALRVAQNKVREYKNQEGKQQFEDPFFWAGFILLD